MALPFGSGTCAAGLTIEGRPDPGRDTDKDAIGVESTMNYLQQLNVNPESCEIFVVLDIVQAPSFGEIKREGYVNGWKATG